MADDARAERAPETRRPDGDDKRTSLSDLALLFLRLGATAFGGPAAHIAMMRDEVVRRRGWLTDERFLDLLGATNLIPGPNSTELAIHIGWERRRWAGLVVAGLAFILPAMLATGTLGWAYVRFGSVPAAKWLLYGVKPVILGVVLQAIWSLALFPYRAIGVTEIAGRRKEEERLSMFGDTRVRPFYDRYGRVVLDRARVLLGDGDAAKDALQEVLLRAVTSEAHILDEPSPVSWLYRVTTNLCLNQLRNDKRRKELLKERDQARLDGSGTTPNDPEVRVTVLQILNRVPPALQEIAVYHFVDEMTHDEIWTPLLLTRRASTSLYSEPVP